MTTVPEGATSSAPPTSPSSDRSLGEIVGSITTDLSTLVRQEIDLAKTELKQEAVKAGKGAGMLAGAGLAGHFALIFVSLTLMFGLDTFLHLWLAALITTLLWAAIAGVLALLGRKNLQQANPQLPMTQQSLKEDAQWVKAQKS